MPLTRGRLIAAIVLAVALVCSIAFVGFLWVRDRHSGAPVADASPGSSKPNLPLPPAAPICDDAALVARCRRATSSRSC